MCKVASAIFSEFTHLCDTDQWYVTNDFVAGSQRSGGKIQQLFGENTANNVLIQYGGSVKPDNAANLLNLPDVDGALVGGASLKADQFLAIIQAAVR